MNIFKNVSEEKQKTELTTRVLNCISSHLSGRADCRGMIYRVAIYVRDDDSSTFRNWSEDSCLGSIFFDTIVRVYPDIHHRRDIDRRPVIQHVIIDHFYDELFAGAANGNQVQILRGKLVPGIYEYRPYSNNNRRRWFKIK